MGRVFFVFMMVGVAAKLHALENSDTNQVVGKNEIVVTASRIETLLETTPEVIHVIDREEVKEIQPSKKTE